MAMNNSLNKHNDRGHLNTQILAYLNNSLSVVETRKIEESILKDQMLDDAMEGLRLVEIEEAAKIDFHLKNYIRNKVVNKAKPKTQFNFPYWLIMTIILLLTLISIGFAVVTELLN